MQLVAGQRTSLQVGDLPRSVAEHWRCHPAIVYLGHREVVKIVKKHGDLVKVEQLQTLPFAIRDGEYRDDPVRGDCATIFYNAPRTAPIFLIGLKRIAPGCEVWVQTFFKIDQSKVAKRRLKTKLLRGQIR